MKNAIVLIIASLALAACHCADCGGTAPKRRNIAVQMWSLHDVSLAEAIQKLKGLDIDAIECYPGQKIGGKYPDTKLLPGIEPAQIEYAKKLADGANLKIVSFGVATANNEEQIEALCKLATALGAKRVLTEARVVHFPIWEKMCQKYGITMCLHHHALDAPNQYYDAYVVKKYTAPFKNIKANPDVGHLVRSNISAVETIKQLAGKIGSVHIKDEDAYGKMDSRAAVLGKGFVDIPNVLKELDRQNYGGYLVIEYEDDWGKNIPHIKACVDYLRTH